MSVGHRHGRGVLDTNAVIALPRIADAGMLPAEPTITTITLAELSVGPLAASDAAERRRRQAHLQQAEADFDPLPFDDAAARAFGQVAADLRASGRKPAARAYDALIAAHGNLQRSAAVHRRSRRLRRHHRSRDRRRACTGRSTPRPCGLGWRCRVGRAHTGSHSRPEGDDADRVAEPSGLGEAATRRRDRWRTD